MDPTASLGPRRPGPGLAYILPFFSSGLRYRAQRHTAFDHCNHYHCLLVMKESYEFKLVHLLHSSLITLSRPGLLNAYNGSGKVNLTLMGFAPPCQLKSLNLLCVGFKMFYLGAIRWVNAPLHSLQSGNIFSTKNKNVYYLSDLQHAITTEKISNCKYKAFKNG